MRPNDGAPPQCVQGTLLYASEAASCLLLLLRPVEAGRLCTGGGASSPDAGARPVPRRCQRGRGSSTSLHGCEHPRGPRRGPKSDPQVVQDISDRALKAQPFKLLDFGGAHGADGKSGVRGAHGDDGRLGRDGKSRPAGRCGSRASRLQPVRAPARVTVPPLLTRAFSPGRSGQNGQNGGAGKRGKKGAKGVHGEPGGDGQHVRIRVSGSEDALRVRHTGVPPL